MPQVNQGTPLYYNVPVIGRKAELARLPRPGDSKSGGYRLVIDTPVPDEEDRLARESLTKQIEALQDKLERQTRDFKQAIEARVLERSQAAEQYNYIRDKDMDKVKTATEKLVFFHTVFLYTFIKVLFVLLSILSRLLVVTVVVIVVVVIYQVI